MERITLAVGLNKNFSWWTRPGGSRDMTDSCDTVTHPHFCPGGFRGGFQGRRGAEISCLSNYSLKQLNKLYSTMSYFSYSIVSFCLIYPFKFLLTLSSLWPSSLQQTIFFFFYSTSNSRGTIFSECRCFLTWWERMESITERLYVGTVE